MGRKAKEEMTARERVLAALAGREVDRAPVANPTSVATTHLMKEVGAYFPAAHYDAGAMCALAETSHTILGFDTIAPVFSVVQEAAALGCDMEWADAEHMPAVKRVLWTDPEQITVPGDFLDRPAARCVLQSIRALKRKYGEEAAILGKAMGPWTLAYNTFGVQEFLLETVMNPGKVRAILERLKEVTVLFAQAQVEAGADAMVLPDHATGDLVSGAMYHDFLHDLHVELPDRVEAPTILHICGNTTDRLESIAESHFDCFHYDNKVDVARAQEIVAGRIVLAGSVENVAHLYKGTPADVAADVRRGLDHGVGLIGPECAIPLQVPTENLLAIKQAVLAYAA